MKTKILDTNKSEKGSKDLPSQFSEEIREDLIRRAVLVVQASKRQPYGAHPTAGMRHSTEVSRRRRAYRGSYGKGISRVPRKVLSHSGTQFNWVGALMPGTVGGRQAHPPKAEKIWTEKINEKENRKAIRSAISATINREAVEARGHKIPKEFPFIIDSKFESLSKTKDVEKALSKLGFDDELDRTAKRKVRAGKGKARGRKYQSKTGVLFVVSKACSLTKAAINVPGCDVVSVHQLNAEVLAPGAHPGRLTLWSDAAVDILANEKLFSLNYKGTKKEKSAHVPKRGRKANPVVQVKAKPKKTVKKVAVKKETKSAVKAEA